MMKSILDKIFLHEDHATFSVPSKLANVESYIVCVLEAINTHSENKNPIVGRIGPKKTIFDVDSNVGAFIVDKDRLGVSSQSNFSTIRANTCVFQGKWQYELMLGSKGVMQVGWTTVDSHFSQEKGVGDTPNSFAFDGNRVRKWNVSTHTYGEGWLTGDVIGCTVDLDEGVVSFHRNGHNLGEAFSNVCLGPGLCYFPAVSLAYSESLVANFGANPFKYPVDGYRPLQEPPFMDVARMDVCLTWLRRIINLHPSASTCRVDGLSSKSALLIVASHIFQQLGPLLPSSYVVEASLIPFLMHLHNASKNNQTLDDVVDKSCMPVNIFLDLLWTFVDEVYLRPCLDSLAVALLTAYRFSSTIDNYHIQILYLNFTIVILKHLRTRHYLLQNVLFDKIMFPVFLYVKPPDDDCLKLSIPSIWWSDGDDTVEVDKLDDFTEDFDGQVSSPFTVENKKKYFASITNLRRIVAAVEKLQIDLLLLLMDDQKLDSQSATSLSIFSSKFREFLKENMVGSRMVPLHLCPLPVSLCFFHCLVRAMWILWDRSQDMCDDQSARFTYEEVGGHVVVGPEACIPTERFFNGSMNYFENSSSEVGGLVGHLEVRRLGGLASHLRKIHAKECSSFLASSSSTYLLSTRQASLLEVLDGIVLLYQIAAHKQLGKMCSLRDNMQDYVAALTSCQEKLAGCQAEQEYECVQPVLRHSCDVFMKKLCEQGRHMAWVKAIVYSPEKRANVDWLLKVILRTLETASRNGNLFSFMPDFYVDVCINCCFSLTNYFVKNDADELDSTFSLTLVRVATFLSEHFMDKRIMSADLKDNLVQALASFVCKTSTLVALESIPAESRVSLVHKLIQPYENRAWAQSNWILLRFWKGCGFAFNYKQPPHLLRKLGPKLRHVDTSLPNQFHKPCPSVVYQEHIAETLLANVEGAVAFLNSVLNQLNWAFSEFIGMLQEIQNASNCTGRVFIDSRQLKICSTCFDLAVALLRVLEMVVTVVPELLTDWTRLSSAEPLLNRVCQLLCQVLNRVTSRSSCFDLVVSLEIQGLDSIDHFPIITAVIGILIQITMKGDKNSCECATKALIAEPSFQISSLEYLLGIPSSRTFMTSPTPSSDPSYCSPSHNGAVGQQSGTKIFSLRNYEEVSQAELDKVERLIEHLWIEHSKAVAEMKDTSEDELCPICYAHGICAIFRPCGHQSCRACISHHLMNKTDCFFCKSNIEMVVSTDGTILHDLKQKQTTV